MFIFKKTKYTKTNIELLDTNSTNLVKNANSIRADMAVGDSKKLLGFAWYSATILPTEYSEASNPWSAQGGLRALRASYTSELLKKHPLSKKRYVGYGSIFYRSVQNSAPYNTLKSALRDKVLSTPLYCSNRADHSAALRNFVIGGPQTSLRVPGHYFPKVPRKLRPADTFYSGLGWRRFRMRWESYLSKQMGVRTYIWFANIWRTMVEIIKIKIMQSMRNRVFRRLSSRAFKFFIRDGHSFIFFQSIVLAALTVTGLQFFMKMIGRHMRYRSHWAYILNMVRFFDICKSHFYFKSLYQYRVVVRGKFGGQLRAKQKVFQNGVLRLHQWSVPINYYRICPTTKYGSFSIRFWLQIRDLKLLRLNRLKSAFIDTKKQYGIEDMDPVGLAFNETVNDWGQDRSVIKE